MSILDLARRAGDVSARDVAAGILIYAPPGAGKTHTAVMGGRPLVVLMERNGLTTVRRANPDAQVLVVDSVREVRDVVLAALHGEVGKAGFDRIVFDSLTEFQRMLKDEILSDKGEEGATFSLQDWGILTDRMRKFLRTIRSMPIAVVATALAAETQDDTGKVMIRPAFEGRKTSAEVAQFFSAVGVAIKRVSTSQETKEVTAQYRTMFDGPSTFLTKSCGDGVCGVVDPDVVGWLASMQGGPVAVEEDRATA